MASKTKHLLTLFGAKNCCLCEEAQVMLKSLSKKIPFDLEYIDIHIPKNAQEYQMYKFDIPVLHLNGNYFGRHKFTENEILEALSKK